MRTLRAQHIRYGLLLLAGFLASISYVNAQAYNEELLAMSDEAPLVADLLKKANALDANAETQEASWKAAGLYCEAARYGSSEAAYRLGMLYAFGRGVEANRSYAATLFGLSATQGHYEAQRMLETIEIKTNATPPCIIEAVLPIKAPGMMTHYVTSADSIDTYIDKLPKQKRWVVDLVKTVSDWYEVDPKLVLSIITAESNFNVAAVSNKEAQGLMQLIPETAERFNVKDAFNASQNIKGGVKYIRWLLAYFKGDVKLVIAAYNAGEGAVDKHQGVPPYKETEAYVARVMHLYQQDSHAYNPKITDPSAVLFKSKIKTKTKTKVKTITG